MNSPSRLFNALFAQSPLPERNIERERLTHRSSVLDALMGSAKSLQGRLQQTHMKPAELHFWQTGVGHGDEQVGQ